MNVLEKIKGTHITIGALLTVIAMGWSGWGIVRPQIVLAEDLEQVEQTWAEAIQKNTDALTTMQIMDIKGTLREISRELAKLRLAHEAGEWDEDMAMYEADLIDEQAFLRLELEQLSKE